MLEHSETSEKELNKDKFDSIIGNIVFASKQIKTRNS